MIPSRDLSVRRGNGWTIVETAGIQRTPGAGGGECGFGCLLGEFRGRELQAREQQSHRRRPRGCGPVAIKTPRWRRCTWLRSVDRSRR